MRGTLAAGAAALAASTLAGSMFAAQPTITPGGAPVAVSVVTPGDVATVTFDAVAGRRVSLEMTDVTIGTSTCCSTKVSIAAPDGRTLVSATVGTSGGFIDAQSLPDTGTAGNTDATPASRTWMVDFTAPAPPVIESPADGSLYVTGTITLSGTAEAGSFVELFDGAASKGGTTATGSGTWSKTLTGVADGSHTYTAKATDAASNTSAPSNARTIAVDTVAPTTTILDAPTSPTGSTAASFTFEANEAGSSFECSLDGAAFTPCATPESYSGLASGSHAFSRPSDRFGWKRRRNACSAHVDDRRRRARNDDRIGSARPDGGDGGGVRVLFERSRIDVRMLARRRRILLLLVSADVQRPGHRRAHLRSACDRRRRQRGCDAGDLQLDRDMNAPRAASDVPNAHDLMEGSP